MIYFGQWFPRLQSVVRLCRLQVEADQHGGKSVAQLSGHLVADGGRRRASQGLSTVSRVVPRDPIASPLPFLGRVCSAVTQP